MYVCLSTWLEKKTKITVMFKYGRNVNHCSGYIKNFDVIGITITTDDAPKLKKRVFPWSSVLFIEQAKE